jgi:DNA-binding response OmpR family regulator
MKALIVDDDLVLADVLSFTLRRAGFRWWPCTMGELHSTRGGTDRPI